MIALTCGFCLRPLPTPRRLESLAALAGQVHLCRHCGAAYLVASESVNSRAVIGRALRVAGHCLQLSVSACLGHMDRRALFLVCGWDPSEMLSTVRVAQILELHRATVQQHAREGRFPGARLTLGPDHGTRGYWGIPRSSLPLYLRNKGKAFDEI